MPGDTVTHENILEVKDLCVHFYLDSGVVKAVDHLDFALQKGSTLGIVGESGSGKSVTALAIMDLLKGTTAKVTGGEIFFNGRDLNLMSADERRLIRGKDIAMIFQEPMTSLNPTMKIGRQIEESIKTHQSVSGAQAREITIQLLKETGLGQAEKIMKWYPYQISGGQRQRVMVAMAIACNPQILIADEPTTSLDVTIQAQILDLMAKLKDLVGSSIIFITHNLGVVAEICDQVIVMYCSRAVEYGNVYDIFGNPKHPYTRGLMASIPRLGQYLDELYSIPGNVPDPKSLPDGCKFAPRCPEAFDKCAATEPPLFDFGNGHKSRCWLCETDTEVLG
jgi:oligopeptide/dipeptide ABC transporter ATP-binding protein